MDPKDTGQKPETGTGTEPLKNDATPVQAPQSSGNAANEEAEKLRKELEQITMERNQLRNKLDETAAEKAERERKELEANQKWEQLAKQEREAREALEATVKDRERQSQVAAATEEIFKDYSSEVVELAKEAGLSLTEPSEDEKAKLKATLDKFAEKVTTSSGRARPTNPNVSSTGPQNKQQMLDRYIDTRDPQAFEDLLSTIPSVHNLIQDDHRD